MKRDKTKMSTITFILLLAFSPIIAIAPTAFAYTAMPDRPTFTTVAVSPTLVGLNQQILVDIIINPAPNNPTYNAIPYPAYANVTCTITLPDGTKDTFMPTDNAVTSQNKGVATPGLSAASGHLLFTYTPTKVGNYSITANCPGLLTTTDAQLASANLSVYYKPSASKATTFTVQEEPVLNGLLNGYPWSPLPNAYWENPVSTDNREWASISGAWVMSQYDVLRTSYNPYSTAPLSSHIVWANQVGSAGLAGGVWGSYADNQVTAAGSIILNGKIYQASATKSGSFDCIDLRTGEILWSASGSLVGAQQLNLLYQNEGLDNMGGIQNILWSWRSNQIGTSSNTWVQYNPNTGATMLTLANVPTDVQYIQYDNANSIFWIIQTNIMSYNTTKPLAYSYCNLIKWDFSKLVSGTIQNGSRQNWLGQNIIDTNWLHGIVFNVSVLDLPGQMINFGSANVQHIVPYPFAGAGSVIVKNANNMELLAGFDYDTGAFLWVNNATGSQYDTAATCMGSGPNGPFISLTCDPVTGELCISAFDVKTGKRVWKAPTGELPWSQVPSFLYMYNNGVDYFGSYDGYVYAYNSETGKLIWKSDYVGDDWESTYGHQPFNGAARGAGGVLYYSTSSTYSAQPRTRFHELIAVNETTGKFMWTLPIGIDPTAIAYGYLLGSDGENGMQYCIGKGKTATSITAPLTVVPLGDGVLLQGFVKDMSPGAPDTPAVSDEDMDEWMDYLYGQNATLINAPPTPKGVTVRLSVVDPNGNSYEIGTATSDSSGLFKTTWNPELEGEYTIYATFDGSNSYWGSYAATAISVSAAPTVSPTSTSITMPPFELYTVGTGIAVIIAVAIVGLLILRKRP